MEANYTPAPQRKRGRGALVAGIIVAVIALGACAGLVGVIASSSGEHPGITAAEKAAAAGAAPAATVDAGPAELALTADNVTLRAKIASQHCFGSAGCNTEVDVKAGWPDGFSGTYEVAYTMTVPGADDSSDTITIYAETGKYDQPATAFLSPQHKVKASACKIHIDSIERVS
jgi:hypothetical protein